VRKRSARITVGTRSVQAVSLAPALPLPKQRFEVFFSRMSVVLAVELVGIGKAGDGSSWLFLPTLIRAATTVNSGAVVQLQGGIHCW
jgi:hypothetical protein